MMKYFASGGVWILDVEAVELEPPEVVAHPGPL